MRIGTWNVEYAKDDEKNLSRLRVLRGAPADIWVLTETHDSLDLSPDFNGVHSEQRPAQRPGSRWTSIWTRYEVLETIDVVDRERTVAAVLKSPIGPLLMFGTVLPWQHDRGKHGPDTEVRSWSEHYREIDEQSNEWATLQQRYPGVPLVVAGDLNVNLGGRQYYGTNEGRARLTEAMHRNRLACATTADRIRPGMLRHSPIDHVLLPEAMLPHATVTKAWEGSTPEGVRLSDHSGLVVQLDLKHIVSTH